MNVLETKNAPGAIGPYSQGYEANGLVITSGQIPVNPADGTVPQGIAAQAEQSCKNVAALLEAAALLGEKSWTDFTGIIAAAALAFVLMRVFSDGIWNIAEAMNGIKMVGIPELAGMNYQLLGVNLAAVVTAIAANFMKK